MNTTIEKVTTQTLRIFVLAAVGNWAQGFAASEANPPPSYQVYSGSTHAHTVYTWSHGEQWAKTPAPRMSVMGAVSYPSTNNVAKSNWQNVQGSPAAHYALAKSSSYDFFTTTDHSQEAALQPVSPVTGRLVNVTCGSEQVCRGDSRGQVWPVGPGETTARVEIEGSSVTLPVKVVEGRSADARPQAFKGKENYAAEVERQYNERLKAEEKARLKAEKKAAAGKK